MNFRELNEQTMPALSEIERHHIKSGFWDFYHQLLELQRKYFSQTKNEDLSAQQFKAVHSTFINGVKTVIQKADLGRVFVSLRDYKDTVHKAGCRAPLIESGAYGMNAELDKMWEDLSKLMKDPMNFPLIIKILDRFEKLEERFQYFRNCRQFLSEAEDLLDDKQEAPEKQAGLELEFSLHIETLADLTFRLNSLQVVYTEACLIIGVNESTYPLTLSKIESGSLWIRLFGENKVIEFVVWFFKNSICYLHRKYTLEGKFERIPVEVKALDEQFSLFERLKEILPEERYKALLQNQGETLAKASYIMAKHTQTLLEREAKFKIDGEVIKLEYPHEDKYIEAAKKQLPEHSNFIVLDPDSVDPPLKALPEGKKKAKEDLSTDEIDC